MASENIIDFQSLTDKVGRFNLRDKTFLIPQMNRIGGHLLAATFRGFGIRAKVMDTCRDLELGQKYTSGKECYPCQITTGDILSFMGEEKERLGDRFDPEDYIYFMPEADGPCRFGMYNKFQRIVLDSLPGLDRLKIGAMTTKDGYALTGMIEAGRIGDLRKAAYLSVVVGDVLDRLLWRVRPYERAPGLADEFIERAMGRLEDAFETHAGGRNPDPILDTLEAVILEGKALMDPAIPPKPLIGIVGEIYLRTHVKANQDVIRVLERYGAEVVNASIAEWINYTTYDRLREAKHGFRMGLKRFRIPEMTGHLKKIFGYGKELLFQQAKQKQVYRRARRLLDIAEDHRVGHLEDILKEDDLFSFDVGTEACLSIPGIVAYAREHFNGVVNVYPFTCMPSTITSAVVKPLMNRLRIPYLDTPYDATTQPGREAAIRTFMYQARQHFKRNGRKKDHG
ncbi:MAG: CoA activase [Deltaproteobacteria bacterium]|nr:MAG: CoA activase [Deltaproteobacteria bacterium]